MMQPLNPPGLAALSTAAQHTSQMLDGSMAGLQGMPWGHQMAPPMPMQHQMPPQMQQQMQQPMPPQMHQIPPMQHGVGHPQVQMQMPAHMFQHQGQLAGLPPQMMRQEDMQQLQRLPQRLPGMPPFGAPYPDMFQHRAQHPLPPELLHSAPNSMGGRGGAKQEQVLVCPYGCGKTFNYAVARTLHIRQTHTGERPHKCPFPDCGKAFYSSNSLKSHKRIHTGERPFHCPFDGCESAYKERSGLKYHVRAVHTMDRPYKCNVDGCEKSYMTQSGLDAHLRKHAKRKDKEMKTLKSKMDKQRKKMEQQEALIRQLQQKLRHGGGGTSVRDHLSDSGGSAKKPTAHSFTQAVAALTTNHTIPRKRGPGRPRKEDSDEDVPIAETLKRARTSTQEEDGEEDEEEEEEEGEGGSSSSGDEPKKRVRWSVDVDSKLQQLINFHPKDINEFGPEDWDQLRQSCNLFSLTWRQVQQHVKYKRMTRQTPGMALAPSTDTNLYDGNMTLEGYDVGGAFDNDEDGDGEEDEEGGDGEGEGEDFNTNYVYGGEVGGLVGEGGDEGPTDDPDQE